MLLIDEKIQEIVSEQINKYLSGAEFSFSTLKSLILSKAPIPQVHSGIVTTLNKTKQSSRVNVEIALKTQAHKNQLAEDKKQEKTDLAEEDKDNDQKRSLMRELKQIPTKINNYETECRTLERKLSRLMEKASQTHLKKTGKINLNNSGDPYTAAIDRTRNSLVDFEVKINALLVRQNTIQSELGELETRAQARKERQQKREKRSDARTGYLSTGEGIEDTLSNRNKATLTRNIRDQHYALEKKYSDLIQDSELINFPFFLEELQKHLSKPKAKLSAPDIEALNSLLKLMLQHLEFERQAINTQDSLNKKKQFISSETVKLNSLNNQLKLLERNSPNTSKENQKLKEQNITLTKSMERNTHVRQRMSTPALLLLVLSCMLAIPLILTLSGVIPFFIAPALVYALVITPPALSLLATIALGITAIVYTYKANSNDSAIKSNQQSIETNINKMERNAQNLKTLSNITIPNLEAQIKKDEAARDNLIDSLKNSQEQAAQTLIRAKTIEPISFANTPFLNEDKNNQLKTPTRPHPDEDPDESTDLELEDSSSNEENDLAELEIR